jgi:hypothetical protein
MWSDRYYYLNICSDSELSEDFNSIQLLNFLETIPEIRKVNEHKFRNLDSFPHLEILVLKARSLNSWSNYDTNKEMTNLLAIVCSKSSTDFERIKTILIRIASFLNWPLIDEETDDGEENKVLWTPG